MLETHRTPTRMAKVLVQYMDDPQAIWSAIRSEFNDAPSLDRIKALRAEFLAPSAEPISWKIERDRYAASMERANCVFLSALVSEHPHLLERAA